MSKRLLLAIVAALTVIPVFAGPGEEPGETEETADSLRVYDLDEIVIVPQTKEHNLLRQQPISSTVMTYKEIENLALHDLKEISEFVPSFVMPNYGPRFTSSIYVRGIGSRVNSPSMGVYIDDIPLVNKSSFTAYTYQLDRVDVLRGPQGTLYGINTEGGLVRQYTRNPMNYQGTDVNLGIGTHFYRNTEVAHYAKLSDKLAFSIAGFYDGANGFFRNSYSGKRADKMDEAGGRLRLVYNPTDRLTMDWMADYQWVKQKAYPYGLLDAERGKIIAGPRMDTQPAYKRKMFNNGLALKYKSNGFDFSSNTSYQYINDNLLMDNDYSDIDFIVVDQSQIGNALTQEFSFKSNNDRRWQWTTGVFGSYQWLKTVAPNTFGSAFSSMMKSTMHLDDAEAGIYNAILASMMQRMPEAAARAAIEQAGGVNIGVNLLVPSRFHTPQFNLGVFHESDYDITGRITATLGLRYDYTKSKISYNNVGNLSLLFSIMGQDALAHVLSLYRRGEKADFSQMLPKFGLTYKLNDGSNIYANVSKGYRAGGFNIQMFGDIIQNDLMGNARAIMEAANEAQTTHQDVEKTITPTDEQYASILEGIKFKPEESWNYELGSHLNLFNNLIHADLALFYMQIRNQQLSVFNEDYGYGRKMVNAGKSYSCGAELTLRGTACNGHLSWSGSYAYTHAVFKEYKTKESAQGEVVDYKDNIVPFVPEHMMAAVAGYRFDITNSVVRSITLGANVNAMGKIYWDEANTFNQKFYATMGARLSADFGLCTVNLWGRNLTDTKYNTFAFLSRATGQSVYSAQRGNPIQAGIDISFHF